MDEHSPEIQEMAEVAHFRGVYRGRIFPSDGINSEKWSEQVSSLTMSPSRGNSRAVLPSPHRCRGHREAPSVEILGLSGRKDAPETPDTQGGII